MLELVNVSKFYSANGVTNVGIQNVNLKLNKGEFVAITGESGSGKSTLLNVISKIDTFDEGEIYYKGNETSYFSVSDMDDFRKNKIGFIFQNYNILDAYTVLENVMIPLILKGLSEAEAKEKALDLIEKVGLKNKINNRGSKLSGGEKQRCVIARALASDCEILACDEPTGNLDKKTAESIIKLIHDVAKDKLVLVVTHNYPEVEPYVTRQIKVSDGRIIEDVSYEKMEDDQKEELNLDYVPLNKKAINFLTNKNIKSTPKKTVLISIVFFLISILFAFAIQMIYGGITSTTLKVTDYNNSLQSTVYAYHADGSKVDLAPFKKMDYLVNPFSMEKSIQVKINDQSGNAFYVPDCGVKNYYVGNAPKNDNEVTLCVSELAVNNYFVNKSKLKELVGKKIVFPGVNVESDFVVSGVKILKDDKLSNIIFNFGMSYKFSDCPKLLEFMNILSSEMKVTYEIDGIKSNTSLRYDDTKTGDITLFIPNAYKDSSTLKYEVNCYDMYEYDNIKVEYWDNDYLYLVAYKDSKLNMDPYFVYVKVNSFNYKSILNKLHRAGLSADYPYTGESDGFDIQSLITRILAFIAIIELSAYLIAVFFITYLILSRVYKSKKKDFEILRVLGVTKKDMAKIVKKEFFLLSLISSVTSYVIIFVIFHTIPGLIKFSEFNFFLMLFYFGVTLLFGLLMAKRFNKNLFQFTASKSMRGDDDND